MSIIYALFIEIFILFFRLFSLVNKKAKSALIGRKDTLSLVAQRLKGQRVIWMHAASLGEYEQGLPVLLELKARYPHTKVLVSFFSPSGYVNVVKKENPADLLIYLPFDRLSTMRKLVGLMEVHLFFTVKYDYWYNLLKALKETKAKVVVVSAFFYENQVFFKLYGGWFVKQLKRNVDWIFHQTTESSALAKSVGLLKSSVTGDTRYDRVKQITQRDNYVPFLDLFIADRRSIVFGSSWEAEERAAQLLNQKLPKTKLIIAPHDLGRVHYLKGLFPGALLYSSLTVRSDFSANVLIIDNIGLLSKIYSYGDLAIIGGGFHNAGLHNILEAAAFGKPVFYGNQYRKNPEADALIKADGGKSFPDEFLLAAYVEELIKNHNRALLGEISTLQEMSCNAAAFIVAQPDATQKIMHKVLLLLEEK